MRKKEAADQRHEVFDKVKKHGGVCNRHGGAGAHEAAVGSQAPDDFKGRYRAHGDHLLRPSTRLTTILPLKVLQQARELIEEFVYFYTHERIQS